jgi:hypothetical protein
LQSGGVHIRPDMTAICANETALSTQVAAQIDRRLTGYSSRQRRMPAAFQGRVLIPDTQAYGIEFGNPPARVPSLGETGAERRHWLATWRGKNERK